ncbi:MAG: hypothetical protein A4S14_07075 [Proteobacteria bacterium SG_bin9]|nr:MAG: hypothetical protein A4S14_07075 [Proteobacteria bacterium SG_bin9]
MQLFQLNLSRHFFPLFKIIAALFCFCAAPLTATAQPASEQLPISLVINTGHSSVVDDAEFSPDGRFALTRYAGIAKMWDREGNQLRTISSPKEGSSFNISEGSRLAAFERFAEGVDIVDLYTGEIRKALTLSSTGLMALSPDGTRLLMSQEKLELVDVASGQTIHTFSIPKKKVFRPVFLPGGREFISLVDDNSIAVWNLETRELVRKTAIRPPGKFDQKFSPRGNFLALTAQYDSKVKTTIIVDTATGAAASAMPHNDSIFAFSPDGTLFASASDKQLKLWSVATGKLLRSIKVDSDARVIALSPDGRDMLICDNEKRVRFYDVASLKEKNTPAPNGGDAFKVTPSPDGKFILSGSGTPGASPGSPVLNKGGNTVRLWDAATGRLVRSFGGHATWLEPIAFSPDSSRVLTANMINIKIWDTTTGKLLRDLNSGHDAEISTIVYAPNGRWFASEGGYDKTLKIWNAETNKARTLTDSENMLDLAISPDSKRLAAAGAGWWIKLVNLDSGGFQRTLTGHADHISSLSFSPNSANLASGSGDKTIRIWDVSSGRTLRTLRGHVGQINSVAYDGTGNLLVSTSADTSIRVWDANTGTMQRTYVGHAGKVNAARFINSGRQIVSAGDDGTLKIWDATRTELLLTMVGFSNDEWVSITPEGFFDASSDKASQLLTMVRGLDRFTVDQFYQALYRPDLVREKLAGDPRGLVREAAARLDLNRVIASGNAPTVSIVSPSDGDRLTSAQANVGVDITATNGGVGRVEWRVNGVTVGVVTPPVAPAAGQPLRLTRQLALDEGTNQIEVVAYNQANFVSSVPARVGVTAPAPAATGVQPRLFVMAVGLNNYADPQFRLQFAVPDAEALANGLRKAASGLFSNVDVTLVRDADATLANLDKVFTALSKKVQPTDTVVFFVAGHGKTVNGRYYFIPHAFKIDGDRTKLEVVEAAVVKQGVAQEQWQTWFANIPARRSILLFDTCESGSLVDKDQVTTKLIERGAASDRLAQATGRTIMTASASDQDAQEGFRGHGLFTYNFLEAIDKGDSDGNGKVDLSELATYVYARVTSLSERLYRKRQVPQVKIASSNYPLANRTALLPADTSETPIPSAPTHTISAASELLIQPALGAARVRQLDARTPVTVISSEAGWTLVAREGRMLGYVAARDLAPLR